MFAEAAEAGAVVRRLLSANDQACAQLGLELRTAPPAMVLTCARGSSDNAATFAKYVIETRLGVPVASAAPSTASVYRIEPKIGRSLCLAISQSGSSPDLLALVGAAAQAGALVAALVNAEGSPLAASARWHLPLHATPEHAVAATKSYIASLAAILQLAAAWQEDKALAEQLATLPELLEASWVCDWSPLLEGLLQARGLYVVGRGPGLGIAQEAALKLKETCGLHAEAFSAAEVRHGPMALLGPEFPLLVFRQADETADSVDTLAGEMAARGVPVFIAGGTVPGATSLSVVDSPATLQPLLQVQSFYRAAAQLAVARGLDPDAPPHLKKVTETV